MSPRSRAIEILAAAGLGDQQLERERQRGQLAAENAKAWASLPSSLIPLLGQGIGAYQGQVQNEANTAAEQVAAEHIGDTGTVGVGPGFVGAREGAYVETPAELAAKAVAANKTLTPDKPTGFFDSLGALVGNRDQAAAKARASATTKLATTFDANRTEADKIARQAKLDAQAAKASEAQIANASSEIEARKQATIDAAAQAKTREAETARVAAERATAERVAAGIAAKKPFTQIMIENPDVSTGDIKRIFDEQTNTATKNELSNKATQAEILLREAGAARDYAAGAAAKNKPPKAVGEGAAKVLASSQETMDGLARLAGLKGEFDAANPEVGQGIINSINTKLRTLSVDDPRRTALLGEVQAQFLEWKKEVAGLRWNDEQVKAEHEAFVSAADNPETFRLLLTNMFNAAAGKHNAVLATEAALGRDTGSLKPIPLQGTTAAVPPAEARGTFDAAFGGG